ncbi:hypothetical protein [Intestinimonas butyriciproducens]|jgi:uncharacterized membrane protein|uniref:hypothetical protein n=1 Tax=Intestinimonas butyriciproducens TaxID=1297617 RepID=UPI00189D9D19|nr:hypothetical protein [Intestinimonas butyriciproducens]MBS6524305.1 hypothetical protein [Clostridiales bacterium]MBO3279230.1 hypothetical protein [Intestinimonas butyriciproducens]MCB7051012.1 hypothetical protein [Intestinimonas butyriciproducens]MCI6362781.1 hypothetical protein [Intestinimonas butyriciproducens]MDY3616785.1 hypothetical protein [Intestinimonas butyriciproducens]
MLLIQFTFVLFVVAMGVLGTILLSNWKWFKRISHYFALYIWLSTVSFLMMGFMETVSGDAGYLSVLGVVFLIWAVWASFPLKDE